MLLGADILCSVVCGARTVLLLLVSSRLGAGGGGCRVLLGLVALVGVAGAAIAIGVVVAAFASWTVVPAAVRRSKRVVPAPAPAA